MEDTLPDCFERAAAIVQQTAVFEPVGLSGLIDWYVLLPVHAVIFGGMLREMARRAQGGCD